MCIAKAIGLPTKGTSDETRVMIDGKLAEMGRDSHNVQVIMARDPRGQETLTLRDVDGVFVDTGAPEEGGPGNDGGDGRGDGRSKGERERSDSRSSEHSSQRTDEELEDLRAQNAVLSAFITEPRAEVSSLKEEVTKLREMLKKETERVSEM